MATTSTSQSEKELAVGEYAPAKSTDLRSPCPAVNCLANHGYLPRDGRNMTAEDLKSAFEKVGFSSLLGFAATKIIFSDNKGIVITNKPAPTFLGRLWAKFVTPFKFLLKFCLHPKGQFTKAGKKYMNLDQLADFGGIEHDISLTRHDRAQGDNIHGQPDLIANLLASSSDGGKTITVSDLTKLRLRRIQDQKEANPKAEYGAFQHKLACGEISLLLNCLGDGESVRTDYAKAFFEEERFPYNEGWQHKTGWWRIGIRQVTKTSAKAAKLMNLTF